MDSRLSLFEFSGVDGTGIELARKLQQINISTPILMLTIENRTDMIVKALEAGASGYLLKRGLGQPDPETV
jgi:two-component system nitrate/nitrite response regulator NarL